jgi:hypothetical protein
VGAHGGRHEDELVTHPARTRFNGGMRRLGGGWSVALAMLLGAAGCSSSASPPGEGRGAGGSTGDGGTAGVPSSGAGGSHALPPGTTGATNGSAGTSGAGGSSTTSTGGVPGAACAFATAAACAGTMLGAWCVDKLFPNDPSQPSLTNIWSDGPADVWTVGSGSDPATGLADVNGVAFHWDGCAWTQSPVPTKAGLHDVWGASGADIWAVGAGGTALHWNGSSWSAAATGASQDLGAISGTSGSDIWAVGVGISVHWNGSSWAVVSGFPSSTMFDLFGGDVWAVAPNDVWAALGLPDGLAHFDGTRWTKVATPNQGFGFFGIWADATTGWAVGEGSQIMQLVGGTWTLYRPPQGSAQGYLDVMGQGTGSGSDVWIAGQTVVEGLGGAAFQPVTDVPPGSYRGLWVTASQVWMTGFDATSGSAIVVHRSR